MFWATQVQSILMEYVMRLSELPSLSSSDSQTSKPPESNTSHQAALELLRGYWIVPLYPGRKVPKGTGWHKARRTVDKLLPGQNVGLLLGNVYPWGGFIDLDIDSNNPQDWQSVRKALEGAELPPNAVCSTGGKHGGVRLLYAVPAAFWELCEASGEVDIAGVTVDVRKKGQAVVPPSCPAPVTKKLTHPVIRPYRWQVELPPLAEIEKMVGLAGDPLARDVAASWFKGRGKRLADFLDKAAEAAAPPRDASVGKKRCRHKPTSSCLTGVHPNPNLTHSIEDFRRQSRSSPSQTPGRGENARAARLILPSKADIWNSPFVWWHLLKKAHLRTYGTLPDEGIVKGHSFCDPLRAERKPSVALYPNPQGEYRLHNFRDSATDGKCASVQEFYAAYRQGKGYTEKLSQKEHNDETRRLIRDFNIWTTQAVELADAPAWESKTLLGKVYQRLRESALYAVRTDSDAFAANRWLAGEFGFKSHQRCSDAQRILEAVGLIRRTHTVGPRSKTRAYELCSDGAATADAALAALGIAPDNPRTWYRISRPVKVRPVRSNPLAAAKRQRAQLARKRGVAAALAASRAMRVFDRNFSPERFPRERVKLAGRDGYGNLYYSGPGPPGPYQYLVYSGAGIAARDRGEVATLA